MCSVFRLLTLTQLSSESGPTDLIMESLFIAIACQRAEPQRVTSEGNTPSDTDRMTDLLSMKKLLSFRDGWHTVLWTSTPGKLFSSYVENLQI